MKTFNVISLLVVGSVLVSDLLVPGYGKFWKPDLSKLTCSKTVTFNQTQFKQFQSVAKKGMSVRQVMDILGTVCDTGTMEYQSETGKTLRIKAKDGKVTEAKFI